MGRHCEQFTFRSIFFINFGRQKGAPREAFGSKNGAKIDPKTRSEFKSEKVASRERLGSILCRFGGRPGGIFIDFLLFFLLFQENEVFEEDRCPRPIRERKLTKNYSKMPPKMTPR